MSLGSPTLRSLGLERSGMLATDHDVMPEFRAEELAAHGWGLMGTAAKLATEKDDTFSIDAGARGRYVLKVSHPSESHAEVDFECKLMAHVVDSEMGDLVPRLLPSFDGRMLLPIESRTGPRLARMMPFMSGTPYDRCESSAPQRECVGEVLAGLRHATQGFSHPADGRQLPWNVVNLAALAPLLDAVANPAHQRSLARALNRFIDVVVPVLPELRTQVVHNDFSKSNLLVDHARPGFVTAVLDFGDSVRAPIAVDVSTALLNQLPRDLAENPRENIFDAGFDVLRGYLRQADLTDLELSVLPHLVMGRAVARALITSHRAAIIPGNVDYILRNTEQGWSQLEWFLARDPSRLSALFQRDNISQEEP